MTLVVSLLLNATQAAVVQHLWAEALALWHMRSTGYLVSADESQFWNFLGSSTRVWTQDHCTMDLWMVDILSCFTMPYILQFTPSLLGMKYISCNGFLIEFSGDSLLPSVMGCAYEVFMLLQFLTSLLYCFSLWEKVFGSQQITRFLKDWVGKSFLAKVEEWDSGSCCGLIAYLKIIWQMDIRVSCLFCTL